MAKRKAATLILLTVIFMMLFSTVSVFAQSSLWSARENKSKIVITKNGHKTGRCGRPLQIGQLIEHERGGVYGIRCNGTDVLH